MKLRVTSDDIREAMGDMAGGGPQARCTCAVICLALLLDNKTANDSMMVALYNALPGSDRLLVKDALRTLLKEESDEVDAAVRARRDS